MDAFLDWRFIAICLYPLFSSVVMMAFFKGEWVGYSWNREYRGVTIAEAFGTVVAAVLLSLVIWNTQRNAMFLKTEQINGVVSGKDTKLSTWRESYSCNCHTDSDGDRHCQTCYRTHYYKHFYLYNTSGDWWDGWVDEYKVEYSGSQPDENNPKDRRVPELWRNAWVGMPVSKDHQYKNYLSASGESPYFPPQSNYAEYEQYVPKQPWREVVLDGWRPAKDKILTVNFESEKLESWNFAPGCPRCSGKVEQRGGYAGRVHRQLINNLPKTKSAFRGAFCFENTVIPKL